MWKEEWEEYSDEDVERAWEALGIERDYVMGVSDFIRAYEWLDKERESNDQ